MCGLVGVVVSQGRWVTPGELRAATDAIAHRGPDDEGYCLFASVDASPEPLCGPDSQLGIELPDIRSAEGEFQAGFGFRRLSIQDLSVKGHQPMTRPWSGGAWIMLNGEIYNFVELRETLADVGYDFTGGSDTEVVLAAYKEWGLDCFSRFVGMWSIAIYDPAERRLVLSRDPFGIKPLYYCFTPRRFVFASEIKSLITFDDVAKIADPAGVLNYLKYGRPGRDNGSIVRNVQQIPPGTVATLNLQDVDRAIASAHLEQSDYIEVNSVPQTISLSEATDAVREAFMDSVRMHLRADVPVAVNLSGGIDSSAVAMAARALSKPDVEMHAFSFISSEAFLSEERWIDIVGGEAGMIVHKVRPEPSEMTRDLEDLIQIQDEPIGSLSPYAQYRVFKEAKRQGIKVTLDGQGADEILAGYLHNLERAMADFLAERSFLKSARLLLSSGSRFPGGPGHLVERAIAILKNEAGDEAGGAREAQAASVPEWANSDYFAKVQEPMPSRSATHADGWLRAGLKEQISRTSLPELLRLADRNSMGMSIESRVPFLVPKLARIALSLPEEFLISPGGVTKMVFRNAMKGLVPSEVLRRKDKIGFTVPERQWLQEVDPWVCKWLNNREARSADVLHPLMLSERWEEVKAGRRPYTTAIWRGLNLSLWAEQFDIRFH